MANTKWLNVKSPTPAKERLFYDPARNIIKRITWDNHPMWGQTQYRYIQCRTWVKKLNDLGPEEPEYII